MATRELVIRYAMYVIGKTESNWTWNSVPAFDGVSNIISIGMMQNAGTHARNLLIVMRDNYPSLWASLETGAPALVNDVNTAPATWAWWSSRVLTDNERVAVAGVLGQDDGKRAQQDYWTTLAGGYIDEGLTLGFSLDYPQPLIYFMSMYHQSPQSALFVVSQCGGSATLDYIHATRANNSVLGNYRNRYNETYAMLNAWDGTSEPPDFGQIDTPTTGGQNPGNTQTSNVISRVQRAGDNVVVYGSGALSQGLVCYKTEGDLWIPSTNVAGAPVEEEHTGGGNNPTADAILAWLRARLGQWQYSVGAGRDNSDVTGVADCSSTMWQAFWRVAGIEIGGYTGAQVEHGTEIARGMGWQTVIDAIPLMQPCDLILWSTEGYHMPGGAASHVIMWTGDNNTIIQTGGGNSTHPTEQDINTAALGAGYYVIKRYL